MEAWYSKVHDLKDESESSYLTQQITQRIFYDLKNIKVKDKKKFRERLGPEFDGWVSTLAETFPSEAVSEIIGDDEFWNLTLKLTLG
jgi:hypothetical protein